MAGPNVTDWPLLSITAPPARTLTLVRPLTKSLAAPVAGIPAGWYDLTLQGTAGSGVAFARGLYLA
jgi:hypothetical protein